MGELRTAGARTAFEGMRLRLPRTGDIAKTGLLFLAGRASVLGAHPFAMAMFAAVFDKRAGYLGLIAAIGGLMSVHAGMQTLKYLSAMVIFWLYSGIVGSRSRVISSMVCGGSLLISGAAVMLCVSGGIYDVMLLAVESILSAVMYIVFGRADGIMTKSGARTMVSGEEIVSFCICVGVYVTGLRGVRLPFGISAANIAACLFVMAVALNTGLAAAGSGAMAVGLVCSLNEASAVVLMGLYGLAGLFGNLLKAYGKYGAALGFMSSMVVTLLYTGDTLGVPLQATEVILSAVIFVLVPNRVHDMVSVFFAKSFHAEVIKRDRKLKDYLAVKLDSAAHAFRELEKSFVSISAKRRNMYSMDTAKIFERAASAVCEGCAMSKKCWKTDFPTTYKYMINILSSMEQKGKCTVGSMPLSFRDRCSRCDKMAAEMTHVYRLFKKDRQRMGEAEFARDIVARQYSEFAAVIEGMSSDIKSGFSFMPEYETAAAEELDKSGIAVYEISILENGTGNIEIYLTVELGADGKRIEDALSRALERPIRFDCGVGGGVLRFVPAPRYTADFSGYKLSKTGSDMSGDSLIHFKTDNYMEYIIICDGMGSGKNACRESYMTAVMLKEFLRSGITPATAVEMMNSTLLLKMESDMFTTIDLLCFDLMTGAAEFYKVGSAESYVRRNRTAETLLSQNMPAGVAENISPLPQKRIFSDGDVILMMSDGIADAGMRGETLKNRLLKITAKTPDPAKDIVMAAYEKNGGFASDDMTAAVLRVYEL